MITERSIDMRPQLLVPDALQASPDLTFPQLTAETLESLRDSGWGTIGTIAAFVDSSGDIMLLEHKGRDKNEAGAWGPLSETSQRSGPIIEQPIETLFRGIQEELGIQNPSHLDLWMQQGGGWVINQWPRGGSRPGEYVCGISFALFVSDSTKAYLESFPHGTEEISDMQFVSPDRILEKESLLLRPGVQDWLTQLSGANLFAPDQQDNLQLLDFSNVYGASLRDIEL